jgi:anthrone oxygenase-like protein
MLFTASWARKRSHASVNVGVNFDLRHAEFGRLRAERPPSGSRNFKRVDLCSIQAVLTTKHSPMLIALIEYVAALAAGLFAGAALYINVAEHPSRMGLETRIAALQWAPSYKRATWLQAPLAILSLLCGVAVWLLAGGWGWLLAALLVGAVVPFTFVVIMPTNHLLLAPDRDLSSSETRELLVRWGRLHAVRTLLSLAGAMTYLWLILRR